MRVSRAGSGDVRGSRAVFGDMRVSRAGSGDVRGSRAGFGDMRVSRAGSGDVRGSRAGFGDMRAAAATTYAAARGPALGKVFSRRRQARSLQQY